MPPPPPRRAAPEDGMGRELGAILDEALDRMERRVVGDERPIPLPWSNVSAALGGGLWGGTLVTLVGDTGSGKTQWALQLSVHAAEYGVPVCYVGPDSGVDQIAARLLALKSGQKWSDLYAGRSDKETLDTLRMGYAQAMKALPFHIIGRSARRDQPHDVRGTAEWMRRKYPEEKPGTRPFLMVLDFVQIASGMSHDETKEMMVRHRPRGPPGGQGLRRRGAPGVHDAPRDARRRRRDHRHPPRPPAARQAGPGEPRPAGHGGQGGRRGRARERHRDRAGPGVLAGGAAPQELDEGLVRGGQEPRRARGPGAPCGSTGAGSRWTSTAPFPRSGRRAAPKRRTRPGREEE